MGLNFGGGLFENRFISDPGRNLLKLIPGEYIWGTTAAKFMSSNEALKPVTYSNEGWLTPTNIATDLLCSIEIPYGATITGIKVFGGDNGRAYTLKQIKLSDGTPTTLVTGAINTEEKMVTNVVIDTLTYAYFIWIEDHSVDPLGGLYIRYVI